MYPSLSFKRGLAVALMTISFTIAAHNSVVVIPLDQDEAPTPPPPPAPNSKKIFFTDEMYNGNLGGISGGNDMCQTSANTADVSGDFKAWLGDRAFSATVPGVPNFNFYDLPYVNVDGSMVATDFHNLLVGPLSDGIKSVSGFDFSGFYWTGLTGVGVANASNCESWTSTAGTPVSGLARGYFSGISSIGVSSPLLSRCIDERNLLCVEQ